MKGLQWWIRGHTLSSDARVLALRCYDMIVGEDWLESVSPVWVDYKTKLMRVTHLGKRITLQGVRDQLQDCPEITSKKLQGLIKNGAVSCCIQMDSEALMGPLSEGKQYICSVESDETAAVPSEIQALVQEYNHLFATPTELSPAREADHKINLIPGAQPVRVRPYHYSSIQKSEIEAQLKEMLKNGVVRHSSSSFASPVLLVRKKDGSWRFCVDYRQLNAMTLKHKHPMPVVEELLDELSGAKIFTKLDFRAGYHQIRMAMGEEYKTAFHTHQGLYEFLVMPFGLTNAPATFQSLMNVLFAELLCHGVLVFMDDILIYSETLKEHLVLLRKVFDILQANKFYIKRSKCFFAQPAVEYLGHVISAEGVATDPSKVRAVLSWPTPTNLKQLRGFLGLTRYCRRFIQHYGIISRPLTSLLKKHQTFLWSDQAEQAFQILRQKMVQALVLAMPDFSKQFVLETDACDVGIGAVLMQDHHPLAYLSKHLCPRNQTLSVYEKECLAILMAVEKWRPYLQHGKFLIKIDHKSLLHLTEQRISSRLQQKALVRLMDLNYSIQCKKGINNAVADALSRCENEGEVFAISECVLSWVQKLQEGYLDHPEDKQLYTKLTITGSNQKGYTLQDGIIRYNGRVWVGNNALAQQHILEAMHNSAIGGHSGITATYSRVKALFAWPNMKQTVQEFIQKCQICQQAKVEHIKMPGLL